MLVMELLQGALPRCKAWGAETSGKHLEIDYRLQITKTVSVWASYTSLRVRVPLPFSKLFCL